MVAVKLGYSVRLSLHSYFRVICARAHARTRTCDGVVLQEGACILRVNKENVIVARDIGTLLYFMYYSLILDKPFFGLE